MSVWPVCVSVHHAHALCLWKSEVDNRIPGTGFTDNCEQWPLNPLPLQEPVLLTTEPTGSHNNILNYQCSYSRYANFFSYKTQTYQGMSHYAVLTDHSQISKQETGMHRLKALCLTYKLCKHQLIFEH